MTKSELMKVFDECKQLKCGIKVEIKIPNQEDNETIINTYSSLNNKKEYYDKNYNDDLVNNKCELIRIVNAKPIQIASFSNRG